MAYDSLSADQQELLDLLRNEVADYVDGQPDDLWSEPSVWFEHFNFVAGQLAHFSKAVQMVGLTGLAISCDHLVNNCHALAEYQQAPERDLQAAIASWPVVFLGYLQSVLAKGVTPQAATELLNYFNAEYWPVPFSAAEKQALIEAFDASDIIIDDDGGHYPSEISPQDASLAAPDDVRPELLDGLITELPAQSEAFSSSIEHYIRTGDASYLLTAQRVAHTIKGAGNVVGILGIANLMHYCEDLLETHQKGVALGGQGFADLLLDAADCLANISDYMQGFAPAPDNVHAVLGDLLNVLRGDDAASPPFLNEPVEGNAGHHSTDDYVEPVHLGDALVNDTLGFDVAGFDEAALDFDTLFPQQSTPVPDAGIAQGIANSAETNWRDIAVHDIDAPNIDAQAFDALDAGPSAIPDGGANFSDKPSVSAGAELQCDPCAEHPIEPGFTPLQNEAEYSYFADDGLADTSDSDDVIDEQSAGDDLLDVDALFDDSIFEDSLLENGLLDEPLVGPATIDVTVSADAVDGDSPFSAPPLSHDAYEDANTSVGKLNEASGEELVPAVAASQPFEQNVNPSPHAPDDVIAETAQADATAKIRPQLIEGQSSAFNDNAETKPQFNLTISDDKATELLRVAGEIQIANTQILSRTNAAQHVIDSVLRFQNQLLELAEDLDKRLAREGAMAVAAGAESDADMDPLELERYNELHSFSSRLQEVTTDAQEAVKDVDQSLLELKNIVSDQRQMGFDMQGQVLGIRMLPASVLSSRFSRAVRQAARLTKKSAVLVVEGDDVMVDSRVLHAIADPVLHLLRNAVDHGLENTAAEREGLNKKTEGVITIRFDRVGESVRIRVADDGRGIDYPSIARIARERGLIDAEQRPSPLELERIILMPGFSTRAQATQTSGRGIGLDVVSEQVRQLKGVLSVQSTQYRGTEFEIVVPMSVMSAHLLMVDCEGQVLGLSSRGLRQIIYLQAGDIEVCENGKMVYRLNGAEIPVFSLNVVAGFSTQPNAPLCGALLITQKADGELCGIAVEQIKASEEHVIKPLSHLTYKPVGVTGAAILGSGSVAAVIDVHDLPALRFTDDELERWQQREQLMSRRTASAVQKPVALVVDDSLSARRALVQFMTDLGYDVVSAKDGFEAISQMADGVPTVALIDLEMPRMNGLELAAHMRSQARYRNVPIAMITSRTTARHKLLADNAGVDVYLNKPWSDDELTTALTQLMPELDRVANS
ncbi:MAG TPA: response regulator [Marinagarivorans sp.]